MRRAQAKHRQFQKIDGVLVDKSAARTEMIFPSDDASDATAEILKRIGKDDYRGILALLPRARTSRVRSALLRRIETRRAIEPNLAQILGFLAGPAEVAILRRVVDESLRAREHSASTVIDDSLRAREDSASTVNAVYCAEQLLELRHSARAARILIDAINGSHKLPRQVAARVVSGYMTGNPRFSASKVLSTASTLLLRSDDQAFVNAVPLLLREHFELATQRCTELLHNGAPALRRMLVSRLLKSPSYALPLVMIAWRNDGETDIRLSIAESLAPVLPTGELETLIGKGLDDPSPSLRLSAVTLLNVVDPDVARGLVRRREPDSDPFIEKELGRYR